MTASIIYTILTTAYYRREGILNSDSLNTIFVNAANSITERYNTTYTNNEFAYQLTTNFIRSLFLREGEIASTFIDTVFNAVATTLSRNINNFDGVSLASANTGTENNETSNA